MRRALLLSLILASYAFVFANSSDEIANAPSGIFAKIFASGGDADLATTERYAVQLDFSEGENPKILTNNRGSGIDWKKNTDNSTYFSDMSMLGFAGVKEHGPTTIMITRNGPDYMFYNTDYSGYRPYGILYVLKGSTSKGTGGSGDRLMVGMVGYHNDSTGFVTSSTSDTVVINIPSTNDTYIPGEKYCWDGYNDNIDRGKRSGTHYRVYWVDLVLILNPRVDTETNKLSGRGDTTYCLMRDGNDYRASFNVTIGGRAIAFAIGGYYNAERNTDANPAYLSVNPTAAATNLDLKNELKNGNQVKIGEYNFSTQTVNKGKAMSVTYYFNVSSSSLGSANDTPFFIRHVNADKTNTNPINGLYFKIGVKSNQGNGTVWYDGTFSGTSSFDSGINRNDYISPKAIMESTVRNDQGNSKYHWEDSGDIMIKLNTDSGLSSEDELKELRAGRYTATIYFNVYSNQ